MIINFGGFSSHVRSHFLTHTLLEGDSAFLAKADWCEYYISFSIQRNLNHFYLPSSIRYRFATLFVTWS